MTTRGTFKNLGNLLKEKRKSAQYTQAELARGLGVHSQFVSNWERGQCAPPIHVKKKLTKLIWLKPNEIIDAELADEQDRAKNRLKMEWGLK